GSRPPAAPPADPRPIAVLSGREQVLCGRRKAPTPVAVFYGALCVSGTHRASRKTERASGGVPTRRMGSGRGARPPSGERTPTTRTAPTTRDHTGSGGIASGGDRTRTAAG